MPIIPLILTYWRQILYGIGVLAIICAIFYVKHVFTQNEARRIALVEKDAQIANLQAGLATYLQLNGEIADAISKIKIKSTTVVQKIENSTPPPDGTRFVFMSASGVYTKAYANYSGKASRP